MPCSARCAGLCGVVLLHTGLTCFLAGAWLLAVIPLPNTTLLHSISALSGVGPSAWPAVSLDSTGHGLLQIRRHRLADTHTQNSHWQPSSNAAEQGLWVAGTADSPTAGSLPLASHAAGIELPENKAGSAAGPSGAPAPLQEGSAQLSSTGPFNSSTSATWQERCRTTLGTWCRAALTQQPRLGRRSPAARGNRTCPFACSGRGNCNADTGLCDCPAGL